MMDQEQTFQFERALAPVAFLSGVIAAFLSCCLLGEFVSKRNPYRDFERFHKGLNYMTLYYPTASQMLAIARSRLDGQQIAVIVGGDSRLNGWGQGLPYLWSRQLQTLLGDRYRVFNFAINDALPLDNGVVAAEMLARDYHKIIFLTNTFAGAAQGAGQADGGRQKYFFWDAYYKGLLAPDPARDARLAVLEREKQNDSSYAELKRRAWLDGYLYCQDLWTTFSYCCANTVWCNTIPFPFWKARKHYPDDATGVPVVERYPACVEERELLHLTQTLPPLHWQGVMAGPANPDYSGSPLATSFKECLAEPLHKRTLVVVTHLSPYYISKLSPAVQADYHRLYPETMQALEQAGFVAAEIGQNYTSLDFNDWDHFSNEGAGKFAADLAPRIRALAESLGYTK